VRPAVNSWCCWRASTSGSADIWDDNVVLDEATEVSQLSSHQRTMGCLTMTIRKATIYRVIRQTNLRAIVCLGCFDTATQQNPKLEPASVHCRLYFRDRGWVRYRCPSRTRGSWCTCWCRCRCRCWCWCRTHRRRGTVWHDEWRSR